MHQNWGRLHMLSYTTTSGFTSRALVIFVSNFPLTKENGKYNNSLHFGSRVIAGRLQFLMLVYVSRLHFGRALCCFCRIRHVSSLKERRKNDRPKFRTTFFAKRHVKGAKTAFSGSSFASRYFRQSMWLWNSFPLEEWRRWGVVDDANTLMIMSKGLLLLCSASHCR